MDWKPKDKITSKNAMDWVTKGDDDSKYLMNLYIHEFGPNCVTMVFDVPDMGVGPVKVEKGKDGKDKALTNVLPKDIADAVGPKSYEYINQQGYTRLSFRNTGLLKGEVKEPSEFLGGEHNVAKIRLTGKEIKAAFTYINAKRVHEYTPNYTSATFALHTLKAAGIALPSQLHYLTGKGRGGKLQIATKATSKEEAMEQYKADTAIKQSALQKKVDDANQWEQDDIAKTKEHERLAKTGAQATVGKQDKTYKELLAEHGKLKKAEREVGARLDKFVEENPDIVDAYKNKYEIYCMYDKSVKEKYEKLKSEYKTKTGKDFDTEYKKFIALKIEYKAAFDLWEKHSLLLADGGKILDGRSESKTQLDKLKSQKITGYKTTSASDTKNVYKQLSYLSAISKSQDWTLYTQMDQSRPMSTSYWTGKKDSVIEKEKCDGIMRKMGKDIPEPVRNLVHK